MEKNAGTAARVVLRRWVLVLVGAAGGSAIALAASDALGIWIAAVPLTLWGAAIYLDYRAERARGERGGGWHELVAAARRVVRR